MWEIWSTSLRTRDSEHRTFDGAMTALAEKPGSWTAYWSLDQIHKGDFYVEYEDKWHDPNPGDLMR